MNFCLISTLIAILIISLCYAIPSDLDSVVVVYRHGDRTPIKPYPNDPYKNISFWPVDWGMLTDKGIQQEFELGKYFRQRYADFLPTKYSERDIYVRSSDVDRTLVSAEANLAGLYPPLKNKLTENGVQWQPVPIHTVPEKMDAVIAAKKPCKKHKYLMEKLYETEYFRNLTRANHDLFSYLTRNSGTHISDLKNVEYLYSTLLIESFFNFTLPEWTRKIFPDKIQPLAFFSFKVATYTPELARLRAGPFFNVLINHFNNRSVTPKGAEYQRPKFLMFSAHDTNIADFLNSMGVFDLHSPPYSCAIIFELHKAIDRTYLNIFYKNTTEARPLKIGKCQFDCDLKEFEYIMQDITITPDEWESECNSLYLLDNSFNLIILSSALFLAIAAIGFLLVLAKNRASKIDSNMYSKLPNEEYA